MTDLALHDEGCFHACSLFTLAWISWWVWKLAFLCELVSFYLEKNPSESNVSLLTVLWQSAVQLATTWQCSVCSLARCIWGRSTKAALWTIGEFPLNSQLLASLYRSLHIYSTLPRSRIQSTHGYRTFFSSNLHTTPGSWFGWRLNQSETNCCGIAPRSGLGAVVLVCTWVWLPRSHVQKQTTLREKTNEVLRCEHSPMIILKQ